jgi:hypothetical protein
MAGGIHKEDEEKGEKEEKNKKRSGPCFRFFFFYIGIPSFSLEMRNHVLGHAFKLRFSGGDPPNFDTMYHLKNFIRLKFSHYEKRANRKA